MNAKSWRAVVRAREGKFLLGGKKLVTSSRFETRKMAVDWIAAVMDQENAATAELFPSKLEPEIKYAEVAYRHEVPREQDR